MVEILIASGNHMERKYMGMLMKKEGKKEFLVHSARDLHEVKEICRLQKIDLLVIDIDTITDVPLVENPGSTLIPLYSYLYLFVAALVENNIAVSSN